jgi:1-acyl-sn-glycerol-3-phosphate acyltransferase
MAKKFKVKTRFSLVDRIWWVILKRIVPRPQFIDLNENPGYPKNCILIANHRSAAGPFTYRVHMKPVFMVGAAHQVCEGFRSRWKYLYYTFYQKKCHRPKIVSFLLASTLGSVISSLYRFAGALPIYFDNRIVNTFKYCLQTIEAGVPVAFFPENSDEGYYELPKAFNKGFLTLAKLYYERHGVDIPIYTHLFATNPSRIITGKPMYYHELAQKHSDDEINEMFRLYMNSLVEHGKAEAS